MAVRAQLHIQRSQGELVHDQAVQYRKVMAHLSETDWKVVQNCQEYVFNSSAAVEMVLYQVLVRDGLRLAKRMKKIR